MTKETIAKIIQNNRRPFAVHQIWAEFEKLRREKEAALLQLEYFRKEAKHEPLQ